MKTLIIMNDPPYGNERSYNGLRLAKAMFNKDTQITVFLMADSVICAKQGQKVPRGFYNIEQMLKSVIRNGDVLLCGTCMDARGLSDDDILEGSQRSTMSDLADLVAAADKVLVF